MRRLLLALTALPFLAAPLFAADIQLADDPEHGCLVTLDGAIADGDTARLTDVLRAAATQSRHAENIFLNDYGDGSPVEVAIMTPLNICLNSPGGSLAEAVRLTEAVFGSLGTMIRPGARCESACALVFMAGSFDTQTDIGVVVSRHMHVEGRLGFHAPSLTVPEGSYDATTVARAYQVSVAATETIFRNLVRYSFPPSLAARMHATPPSKMFYVSTVQEAARWNISVVGVDAPTAFTDAVVRTACANLYMATMDKVTSDPDRWPAPGHGGDSVRRDGLGFAYMNFGSEGVGTCEGFMFPQDAEFSVAREFWGSARIVQASAWASGSMRNALPPLNFGIMQNFMAYPQEMPLLALPRNGRALRQSVTGTCFVYGPDDALLDREPCTRERFVEADATLVAFHDWPSGARTVVERVGLEQRVNGQTAGSGYWPDPRPEGANEVNCARNAASRNTFCFHPG